jgi:hypothetical protein
MTKAQFSSRILATALLDGACFADVSAQTGCGCGGIGRRTRFRFWRLWRGGSSPFTRTIIELLSTDIKKSKEVLLLSIPLLSFDDLRLRARAASD